MTARRRRAARARIGPAVAVAVAAALVAALSGSAAGADGPRPENPVGATAQVLDATTAPGAAVSFTGAGFANDGGTGQVVSVKLDDVDLLGQATADDSGALSGTVTLPPDVAPGEHWLRFLAGSGQANDSPARSLVGTFTVVAPANAATAAAPTATPGSGESTGSPAARQSTAAADLAELPKTGVDILPWATAAGVLAVLALVFGAASWGRRRGSR